MYLKRVANRWEQTFGVLMHDNGQPLAVTLENPWQMNKPSVSCIPTGIWQCQRVDSPKFGDTFEVINVPGRSHILFHKGNVEADTSGCILVARRFGLLAGVPGIISSIEGFRDFMEVMQNVDSFTLTIR